MTDEYITFVGGKINKNGMRRRKKRGGSGIMKTAKKCFHAFSSCFPMERHRLSAQLVTIDQTRLVGSGIDNLCLLI